MSEYRKKTAFLGNRQIFISGSGAGSIVNRRVWHEKRLGLTPEGLSGRWYEAIIGRTPAGLYVVAVSYATAVILLGWLPWNILLILLLLASKNKRLRETSRGSLL